MEIVQSGGVASANLVQGGGSAVVSGGLTVATS